MFKKTDHKRRHGSSMPVAILRFLLSLIIFAFLLGGLYSAYRHFSGLDPIKLNPQSILSNLVSKEKALDLVLGLFEANDQKNSSNSILDNQIGSNDDADKEKNGSSSSPLFKFLVVADSHNENNLLEKAIAQAKDKGEIEFIIGLGDYSEVGTLKELKDAKSVFDSAGIRYFVVAGDHDLWDGRDKGKDPLGSFKDIFGQPYQSFTSGNSQFILLNNSDNYSGMGQDQLSWLKKELEKAKDDPEINGIYIFAHEPFYHPSADRVMGKVTPALKSEATEVLKLAKEFGVEKIFSGDIHFFTEYQEPETELSLVTIGAVASLRNPQTARFGLVTVYDDGSLNIEDVEIQ